MFHEWSLMMVLIGYLWKPDLTICHLSLADASKLSFIESMIQLSFGFQADVSFNQ